jgi:hypothetical protein
MKQLQTVRQLTHTHVLPERAARFGWRVCAAGPTGSGLGGRRPGRVMRLVLFDGRATGSGSARWERVLDAAEAMALGLPSRALPPARPTSGARSGSGGRRSPVGAVTALDLFPDGRVVVACRASPSLLHFAGDGAVSLLPPVPGGLPDLAVLEPGERLLALTPSLLQAIPPQSLVELTEAARSGVDSCELWQQCATAAGDALPPVAHEGLDLIVVTRGSSGPRRR